MLWTRMWKSGTRWQPQSKRLPALILSLLLTGGIFPFRLQQPGNTSGRSSGERDRTDRSHTDRNCTGGDQQPGKSEGRQPGRAVRHLSGCGAGKCSSDPPRKSDYAHRRRPQRKFFLCSQLSETAGHSEIGLCTDLPF